MDLKMAELLGQPRTATPEPNTLISMTLRHISATTALDSVWFGCGDGAQVIPPLVSVENDVRDSGVYYMPFTMAHPGRALRAASHGVRLYDMFAFAPHRITGILHLIQRPQ